MRKDNQEKERKITIIKRKRSPGHLKINRFRDKGSF